MASFAARQADSHAERCSWLSATTITCSLPSTCTNRITSMCASKERQGKCSKSCPGYSSWGDKCKALCGYGNDIGCTA